ncbi:hypothetical protein EJ04DRAFT_101616 [Polyplosphaeria fusca]|uniref:Uncharacterized protein n=1 Tax=Polyplosphaeria fusca TaxID=682080 RepID=A0A9P4QP53_9PLEO|nr:hypothetical protein EJ04DRAFT_101616 [Polyplosphaeria fusca]
MLPSTSQSPLSLIVRYNTSTTPSQREMRAQKRKANTENRSNKKSRPSDTQDQPSSRYLYLMGDPPIDTPDPSQPPTRPGLQSLSSLQSLPSLRSLPSLPSTQRSLEMSAHLCCL